MSREIAWAHWPPPWDQWVTAADKETVERDYAARHAEMDADLNACGGRDGGCPDHEAHLRWASKKETDALVFFQRGAVSRTLARAGAEWMSAQDAAAGETTYDPAAVKALIVAAEQALLSGEDADGAWMHVSRWRVEPLRAAVKAAKGGGGQETDRLRNAARVHCNCGGFFTPDGSQFIHADRCGRRAE